MAKVQFKTCAVFSPPTRVCRGQTGHPKTPPTERRAGVLDSFHSDFICLCYASGTILRQPAMRVLVVEDERKISAYVKRGLEEQGYAVDAAFTGREALDWAAGVSFDLIVLDIQLPEMDGVAVCRELRQRGVQAPVLMLTARDTIDDRVAGLDEGTVGDCLA